MAEIYSELWSEAAQQNDGNFPDGWQGGTMFPNIPPIGREMMAAIKRDWNLTHPTLTTGGNGDVVTLTPTTAITEYVDGQIFAAKLNANLGAAGTATRTLNVSGKGAKKIYLPDYAGGHSQTVQSGGEAKAGHVVFFRYDASLDSGNGGFVIYSFLPKVRGQLEQIEVMLTTETGTPVVGANFINFTFRLPYNFTLTGARASLKTAQTSGSTLTMVAFLLAFPSNLHLFNSPYLTIDNGETTSATAAASFTLTSTGATLSSEDEIGVGVAQIGDGTAQGLKVTLLGYQR
jgi:hypothetical protein